MVSLWCKSHGNSCVKPQTSTQKQNSIHVVVNHVSQLSFNLSLIRHGDQLWHISNYRWRFIQYLEESTLFLFTTKNYKKRTIKVDHWGPYESDILTGCGANTKERAEDVTKERPSSAWDMCSIKPVYFKYFFNLLGVKENCFQNIYPFYLYSYTPFLL